jgi:hypothetical protein
LPDGLFSNQKSKFGQILKVLVMEEVGIFYGPLVNFNLFCYILWTFGIVCGNLVYFFPFWYFVPRKIWQPCSAAVERVENENDKQQKLSFVSIERQGHLKSRKARVKRIKKRLHFNLFEQSICTHTYTMLVMR